MNLKVRSLALILPLAVLITLLQVITLIPAVQSQLPRTIAYIAQLLAVGVAVFFTPQVRVNRTLVAFCIACAISLVLNSPTPELLAPQRLLFFILSLGLLSPLIVNRSLTLLRRFIWTSILFALDIVVIASAVRYIPWLLEADRAITPYAGILSHSMLLGILSAVVAYDSASRLICSELTTANPLPDGPSTLLNRFCRAFTRLRDSRAWNIAVTILAGLMLLAAGSRCAMLALAIGIVPPIVSQRSHPRRILATIGSIALFLTVAYIANRTYAQVIAYKFQLGDEGNSLTYSRDELWKARIDEFLDAPLFGIGFANSTHYSPTFDCPPPEALASTEATATEAEILNEATAPEEATGEITVREVIDADGIAEDENAEGIAENTDETDENDAMPVESPLWTNWRSEPGSSWLTILSNTGLIGFLIFAYFNLTLLRRLRRAYRTPATKSAPTTADESIPTNETTTETESTPATIPNCPEQARTLYFLGFWLILLVHGCFEGWILYAGSPLFLLFWLLSSRIQSLKASRQ